MYDNNISTHYPCCRLGIGPDRSGLRCASIPRVARPVLERGTPGDATCVQTPPPTHAPVRAATGTSPGAACAAATDSPRRSAVVVGRGPGHLCPAPLYGPAPGRPYRAQASHRRHRPARLARRPGTTPSPWGSMRERHPCCAEARLRSQGSSTAACPPTPAGVSAGRIADDTGLCDPFTWRTTGGHGAMLAALPSPDAVSESVGRRAYHHALGLVRSSYSPYNPHCVRPSRPGLSFRRNTSYGSPTHAGSAAKTVVLHR